MLMEKLSNTPGVSSFEEPVRNVIRAEIEPYVDEIHVDAIGNLIAHKKGPAGSPKVMFMAHMDEVGMIVRGIRDDGLLALLPLGSVDPRVIDSRIVKVGPNGVPGVIGSKAIHLQSPEDRNTPPSFKMLFVDVGATDKASAEKLASVGDVVWFDSVFRTMGDGFYKGKALDDRAGCAAIITALKQGPFPCDFYAVFSAQEECGMRGAGAAAEYVAPDVAVVFEGTTANDVWDVEPEHTVVRLGDGVVITPADGSNIAHPGVLKTLIALAERNGIRWQYKRSVTGSTDAGVIRPRIGGIPVAVLAVPCRYIHSPVTMMKAVDLEAAAALGVAFLKNGGKLEE